jgi:hypothetical protein
MDDLDVEISAPSAPLIGATTSDGIPCARRMMYRVDDALPSEPIAQDSGDSCLAADRYR